MPGGGVYDPAHTFTAALPGPYAAVNNGADRFERKNTMTLDMTTRRRLISIPETPAVAAEVFVAPPPAAVEPVAEPAAAVEPEAVAAVEPEAVAAVEPVPAEPEAPVRKTRRKKSAAPAAAPPPAEVPVAVAEVPVAVAEVPVAVAVAEVPVAVAVAEVPVAVAPSKVVVLDLGADAVASVDIGGVEVCARGDEFHQYFVRPPGKEHFKLLACLSAQLPAGTTVAASGSRGMNALALSVNPAVRVLTKDGEPTFGRPNITNGGLDKGLAVVLLSTNSRQEVEGLLASGFEGLILVDNIHLDADNREFWTWARTTAGTAAVLDLTDVGHTVGTGALVVGSKLAVK